MLLLTSTSDKIQVITTTTAGIDVHASYADYDGTTVTLGRKNTKITTAATTDVVLAPAAATSRNVKSLEVANISATTSNVVTIQHTDGATVIQLESITLLPGERIAMREGVPMRVIDALGREKVAAFAGTGGNANTADVVANAADTYLAGSNFNIAGRLQAGSFFKWRFRATKTAAGVASATFNIRVGTAGAVGDTSRNLFTSTAAQTAAVDTAMFELDGIFRAVGAAAVISAVLRMDHTAADGAGMGTFRYLTTLSASFDVTPAGTIIGVSCNPGAAGVWTFQNVSVEANNLIN